MEIVSRANKDTCGGVQSGGTSAMRRRAERRHERAPMWRRAECGGTAAWCHGQRRDGQRRGVTAAKGQRRGVTASGGIVSGAVSRQRRDSGVVSQPAEGWAAARCHGSGGMVSGAVSGQRRESDNGSSNAQKHE